MLSVILKRFEEPDETRVFENGRFEVVHIGGLTIGRATYEPGWKWSIHVAPVAGTSLCPVEHVGLVTPGNLFYIPPTPHDSWVVGTERYVSLHFLGAEHYSASPRGRSGSA